MVRAQTIFAASMEVGENVAAGRFPQPLALPESFPLPDPSLAQTFPFTTTLNS